MDARVKRKVKKKRVFFLIIHSQTGIVCGSFMKRPPYKFHDATIVKVKEV